MSKPYERIVEDFFAGYKQFQDIMMSLAKVPNPNFVYTKVMQSLDDFSASMEAYQLESTNAAIETDFLEGHTLLLEGITLYQEFVVAYPQSIREKKRRVALKKAMVASQLSGVADTKIKQAFQSFVQAVERLDDVERDGT